MYYVFRNGKLIFQGTKEEVARELNISRALVVKSGALLGYVKGGYQIINDDENKQKNTWLDDDRIIKLINKGKTLNEIATIMKYPLPGFIQYCKARGYTPENKGHIEKKMIFYPGGYKQCPRCKKWFSAYAGDMWKWKGVNKHGNPVWYCSYTCMRNSEVTWW